MASASLSLSLLLRQPAAATLAPFPPSTANAANARARRRPCSSFHWSGAEGEASPVLALASRPAKRRRAAAAAVRAAATPAAHANANTSPPPQSSSWRDEVAAACADPYALQKLTLKGRLTDETDASPMPYRQASIRPVALRGKPALQVSLLTARQDLTRNYSPGEEARKAVRELLDLPWHSAALALEDGGGLEVQRLGLQGADGKARADGRRKLAQVNALLRLLDATGAMEMDDSEDEEEQEEEVHVLDAGCGASVLTFGVYRHLQKKAQARRRRRGGASAAAARVRLTGVDTNAALMKRSADAARELLDPSDPPASFLAMPIRDYGRNPDSGADAAPAPPPPPPPDLVLALHACDAATDEALALAVRTRARLALAVPCCMVSMHRDYAEAAKKAGAAKGGGGGGGGSGDAPSAELQAAVARAGRRTKGGTNTAAAPPPPSEAPLAALLRHGILKQRLLDLATDSLRAALLRCLGYQADAVEFVSTEHTPRNLLLRSALPAAAWKKAAQARKAGVAPPPLPLDRAAVKEYKAMRAFFGGVAPALEAMLERDGQLPRGWLEEE